jgi:hypothetical protein
MFLREINQIMSYSGFNFNSPVSRGIHQPKVFSPLVLRSAIAMSRQCLTQGKSLATLRMDSQGINET